MSDFKVRNMLKGSVQLLERFGVPPKMREENPTLHLCPDWDFMLVDDSVPEFEACTCGLPTTPQEPTR